MRIAFDLSEIFSTLTASAPARILPHETASSGRAPESEPSNSCPVFCKNSIDIRMFCVQFWAYNEYWIIRAIALCKKNEWAKIAQEKWLRTISIALAIWCLQTPPPRTIIPAFLDFRASSLSARMSPTMSRTRPGERKEWKYIMSPMDPSVKAGQKTGMLF